VRFLRARVGGEVGVFGFSQGAWAASLAAADFPDVSFLALVGCSGVSPARQMRHYTDELLRRAGYRAEDRALLGEARAAVEEVLRGAGDRPRVGRLLAAAVERPWFELSYLPPTLPAPEDSWPDMDYDPEPAFSRVQCPVLLVYGDDEECVPAEASKSVWRRATGP
jgi:pimeloyl-ACP methyl ester carboxylesterase